MLCVYDYVSNLMCLYECPELIEAWGNEFEALYTRYEKKNRFSHLYCTSRRQIKARELMRLFIIQIQFKTGVPYIVFKDHCNRTSNHQNLSTKL
ncbi:ribonucleoside-diphosphate reductase large subunit [Solenopsis invicta]|uniref:ribonucleoside-diphosphate reductase large subunit n=1 Tax=Solenopsis invicta TaxID=13686 RepID=UPI000E33E39D|nr:ribonucleoside-diphosphate reductase large subunit [Solenopsis invicta]